MTYKGVVKKGVIVLDNATGLPEGTLVRVEPIPSQSGHECGSLAERLERLAGTAKGLPRDLARRHDHYLHGHPSP